MVRRGRVMDDPAQRKVLALLQTLSQQLAQKPPARFFRRESSADAVRGLYIWGNVGRGKSMLMDLFYNQVPVGKKRRVHFHAFMQEVHARIHKLRQEGKLDPVVVLAQQISEETKLLCFDELQATDVADASVLYRLFQGLFDAKVVVVSTSNHPPATLYTGGVQRERFDKFIALIEERMQVCALSSADDYRHKQIKSLQEVYFYPLGPEADAFIAQTLERTCPGAAPHDEVLAVQGRQVHFSMYNNDIGLFTFHQLCETALGPADYLAAARRLKMLILTGIPKLPPEKRNEAKRFVTLVDALYEAKTKFVCTAAVAPEEIYAEGDGSFEFKRTVSRLTEMQSAGYLKD